MKAETIAALKASIAKWDKNARVRNLDNATTGADDCALCFLFHEEYREDDEPSCFGCPVRGATGSDWCHGSPYIEANNFRRNGDAFGFRAKAKEEAAFLRSLLPDGETA